MGGCSTDVGSWLGAQGSDFNSSPATDSPLGDWASHFLSPHLCETPALSPPCLGALRGKGWGPRGSREPLCWGALGSASIWAAV